MSLFPTQSQEESRQQLREYEETKKQIEEDADREILDIKNKYERRLREEKEANLRLKGETGIMRKKVSQDLDIMWVNRPDHHLSLHYKERKKIRLYYIPSHSPLPIFLLLQAYSLGIFPRPKPPLIVLFNMAAITLDKGTYALARLNYVCIAGRSSSEQ